MPLHRIYRPTAILAFAIALLSVAATGVTPAHAAPSIEFRGDTLRLSATIRIEATQGCEGDTTCLCTHLATAQLDGRTPDGDKIQARRITTSVYGSCDLPNEFQADVDGAAVLSQRVNSNGKAIGQPRLVVAAASGLISSDMGTSEANAADVLVVFNNSANAVFVPGRTYASVEFDGDSFGPIEVPYAAFALGLAPFGQETSVRFTPTADGFGSWSTSTGT